VVRLLYGTHMDAGVTGAVSDERRLSYSYYSILPKKAGNSVRYLTAHSRDLSRYSTTTALPIAYQGTH
jgi:hypothetical protein